MPRFGPREESVCDLSLLYHGRKGCGWFVLCVQRRVISSRKIPQCVLENIVAYRLVCYAVTL
jgi:hypothetical protein